MQCEKYLFDLTSDKKKFEDKISKKFKEKLHIDVKLNFVRPKGIIIADRSNDFNDDQKRNFQVIKRKYSNIANIVTNDDLLNRINNLIISTNKEK